MNLLILTAAFAGGFFLTNLKSVIEFGNDLREIIVDNEELVNR